MKILSIHAIEGPNIYAHKSVLVMTLDLESLGATETSAYEGFNDKLIAVFPGLAQHRCSPRKPGGFVSRLQSGTYFGHVIEHVALELSELAGIPAFFGKTIATQREAVYQVVVEYTSKAGMTHLLTVAVDAVQSLLANQNVSLEEAIRETKQKIADTQLGPSTAAIVQAADRRGIPWRRMTEANLIELGYGKYLTRIQAALTSRTSNIAVDIASNKELTKTLLREGGIPTPRGHVVRTAEEAASAFSDLGGPVVVKPLDGNQGKRVFLNVTNAAEVMTAFQRVREVYRACLIEECLAGRDYRVLVVGGRMVAACERRPASVTGDGTHAIAQLVEMENVNPLRGEGHERPLTALRLDAIALECLARQHLTPLDVPPHGRVVRLRDTANLSTGGTAIDVTDRVHPDMAGMCERAARLIGLDVCGVDLVAPDISEPPGRRGGIIEVNASPGLRMHHYPSEGSPRDAGQAIIDSLYPEGRPSRIPIISVTGTNGKTTVTRLISQVLSETRQTVGMTTTGGIFINGRCIEKGDTTGPRSARKVLSDPSVEIAVLETARGGIAKWGLGYDWSDISVITNIQLDHIGQDGIESLDDLVHIKSLVAERVREGGTIVLNADSEPLIQLIDQPRIRHPYRRLVLFSLNHNNPVFRQHVQQDGTGFCVQHGAIVELAGRHRHYMMATRDIPAGFNGVADCQIANVLAAVAVCRAFGMSRWDVAKQISQVDYHAVNPGRLNLYRVGEGHVLVDYGHNAEAFRAIGRLASGNGIHPITAVATVPGDRADWIIKEAGRALAHCFDRCIIRGDRDLRGRMFGEVPHMLEKVVLEETPGVECRVILDETAAVEYALESMKPGELVAVFYSELDPIMEILGRHRAVAVKTFKRTAKSPSMPSEPIAAGM